MRARRTPRRVKSADKRQRKAARSSCPCYAVEKCNGFPSAISNALSTNLNCCGCSGTSLPLSTISISNIERPISRAPAEGRVRCCYGRCIGQMGDAEFGLLDFSGWAGCKLVLGFPLVPVLACVCNVTAILACRRLSIAKPVLRTCQRNWKSNPLTSIRYYYGASSQRSAFAALRFGRPSTPEYNALLTLHTRTLSIRGS